MSPTKSRLLKTANSLFLLTICVLSSSFVFAQAGQSNSTSKIYSDVLLTTDSIEEGYTMTQDSVALQPEVGYQWPQARVGFWGSNVSYSDNSESLNLRPLAWYRFNFTPNLDLKLEARYSMFFKSSNRNGEIFTLDMGIFTHHAIVEQNSNWNGTGVANIWLAYQKSWPSFWGLDYELLAGYNMITATGYQSYFDVLTGFGYKYTSFYFELLLNYNSQANQFVGSYNPVGLFQFTAKF